MATTGPSKGEVTHRGCVVGIFNCAAVDAFPEVGVLGMGPQPRWEHAVIQKEQDR